MAKIINQELYEYLFANGFEERSSSIGEKAFGKDDKLIVLYGNSVSLRECDLEGEEIEFAELAHCTGIERLDMKGWKELLDAFKIVPITFQLRIGMNKKLESAQILHDNINNFFGNVKTLLSIILVALLSMLASCNSERQVQMQKGNCKIINGRIYFVPNTTWNQIPFDTSFNGFRVRNTSIRKTK